MCVSIGWWLSRGKNGCWGDCAAKWERERKTTIIIGKHSGCCHRHRDRYWPSSRTRSLRCCRRDEWKLQISGAHGFYARWSKCVNILKIDWQLKSGSIRSINWLLSPEIIEFHLHGKAWKMRGSPHFVCTKHTFCGNKASNIFVLLKPQPTKTRPNKFRECTATEMVHTHTHTHVKWKMKSERQRGKGRER